MNLTSAELGKTYTISKLSIDDEELSSFLFTLGCYEGEEIVLISVISGSYVISIKDSRYTIDKDLASEILIS